MTTRSTLAAVSAAIALAASGIRSQSPSIVDSVQIVGTPADVTISPDGRTGVGSSDGSIAIMNMATGALVREMKTSAPPFAVDHVIASNTAALSLYFNPIAVSGSYGAALVVPFAPGLPAVEYRLQTGVSSQQPVDLALSPNGQRAAVITETATYIVDMVNFAFGTPLVSAQHPIGPPPFPPEDDTRLDMIETTNTTAVGLIHANDPINPSMATRVVFLEHASGTSYNIPLDGSPIDLALSPNGLWAAVRTTEVMSVISINPPGVAPNEVYNVPSMTGSPVAPSLLTADMVEMSDSYAAFLTQSDDTSIAGGTEPVTFVRLRDGTVVTPSITTGIPIDLAVSPDQRRFAVRSGTGNGGVGGTPEVLVFDATGASPSFAPVREVALELQNDPPLIYWSDWIGLSNTRVVSSGFRYVLPPPPFGGQVPEAEGLVLVADTTSAGLWTPVDITTWPFEIQADVDVAPDVQKAAVRGSSNAVLLRPDAPVPNRVVGSPGLPGWFPGGLDPEPGQFGPVDSIEVYGNRAITIAYRVVLYGNETFGNETEVIVLDMTPNVYSFGDPAAAQPNSTGRAAAIGFTGGVSVSTADLMLTATSLPSSESGIWYMAPNPAAAPLPLAGGTGLDLLPANKVVAAAASWGAGITSVSAPVFFPASSSLVGTDWYYQFVYSDGTSMLATGGLKLTFTQ